VRGAPTLIVLLSVSGYVSSRVYETIGGEEKRRAAFFTAILLPTYVFYFSSS
jgi:hypothetical protein